MRVRACFLYCERGVFDRSNFPPGHEKGYTQRAEVILEGYHAKRKRIEKHGVRTWLKIIETEGPILKIAGSINRVKAALKEEVFPHELSVEPETVILLPGERYDRWTSSESGYKIALECVEELGHHVEENGKILRRGFEFQPRI
jgi:hypothetical protein